jgi:beta-glucanase (GH16 family)
LKRRTFFSVVAGATATGAGAIGGPELAAWHSTARAAARPATTYAFADEFNGLAGSAPDPSKWGYDIGGGGWGNQELEIYTASRANSFVDGNGHLVIRATKVTEWSVNHFNTIYYSARLKTLGKFSKYQGTFEARIKLSPQAGLWPAWWMMGSNLNRVGWPACGEVDMIENYGNTLAQTSVHTPNKTDSGTLTDHANLSVDSGWHIWRVAWSSTGFTFYKDGTEYMKAGPAQIGDWCFSSGVPMFMLLNLAVGGLAGTPPASTKFPVDMLVDYVHVW